MCPARQDAEPVGGKAVVPEQKTDEFNVANLLQAQRDLLLGAAAGGGEAAASKGAVAGQAGLEGDEDALVNVKHYIFMVYGRKWWVLLAGALAFASALVYAAYLRPRSFKARAEVIMRENLTGSGRNIVTNRPLVYYPGEALAKLVKNDNGVRQAADRLVIDILEARREAELSNIQDGKEGALTTGEIAELDAALAKGVPAGKSLQPEVEAYSIRLVASHSGRSKAASIIAEAKVEAQARALVAYLRELMGGQNQVDLLDKLIKTNDRDLQETTKKLKEETAKLLEKAMKAMDSGHPQELELPQSVASKLEDLRTQQRVLDATNLQLEEIKESISEFEKFLADVPEQPVNPAMQTRLLQLEAELAQMKDRYTEQHPRYKAKAQEIAVLKDFMEKQKEHPSPAEFGRNNPLQVELHRAQADERRLLARKKALEDRIAMEFKAIGGDEGVSGYESLLRDQRALESIGADLRRKLVEARLTTQGSEENGQKRWNLVGVETIGANVTQTAGFATVLGLVLGVLLALLLEHLDDTVRSEMIARRATGLPVIGKLPRFDGPEDKRFISPASPRSGVAELFKVFHNHVRYARPGAPEKCLLITSPGPEEGKSYVAVNLALSFASEGNRVCFVDADLRRSKTHKRLDVLRPRGSVDAGLCAYLEQDLSYEQTVLPSEHENLSVILAGGQATNPPRMLRSERMRVLLDRLESEFDVVIVDAPPVLPVVDAAILSSLVRGALLVVRFSATNVADLAEAAGRLHHVSAPMAGVVINGVYGTGAGYGYGGYRYRYHYRYSGYGGYGNYGSYGS